MKSTSSPQLQDLKPDTNAKMESIGFIVDIFMRLLVIRGS